MVQLSHVLLHMDVSFPLLLPAFFPLLLKSVSISLGEDLNNKYPFKKRKKKALGEKLLANAYEAELFEQQR